jgi:hypothetical protein
METRIIASSRGAECHIDRSIVDHVCDYGGRTLTSPRFECLVQWELNSDMCDPHQRGQKALVERPEPLCTVNSSDRVKCIPIPTRRGR